MSTKDDITMPFAPTLALLALFAAASAVAAGCDSDLPLSSQLERTRIVGARVVTSDPGRADARPGETASVEWIVLGPTAPTTLAWTFAQCTGVNGACLDAPQPVGSGSAAPIVVPFTAPAAGALADGRVAMMVGAVCADGDLGIAADTGAPSCTGPDASGTDARYVIPLVPDGQAPNQRPNLANDLVELGGNAWTTPAMGDSGSPCDGADGMPVVNARADGASDTKQELRLVTDADDRESFTPPNKTAPELEELQLSVFATAGKFDSSYGAIYANDTRPDADVTMKWAPPRAAEVPPGGMTVQFHLIVRDGRGGLDLTHRSLCVVAP